MTEKTEKFDYVIVTMRPDDDPDRTAARLNSYGIHGYELMPPVKLGAHVVYTLWRREEAGE